MHFAASCSIIRSYAISSNPVMLCVHASERLPEVVVWFSAPRVAIVVVPGWHSWDLKREELIASGSQGKTLQGWERHGKEWPGGRNSREGWEGIGRVLSALSHSAKDAFGCRLAKGWLFLDSTRFYEVPEVHNICTFSTESTLCSHGLFSVHPTVSATLFHQGSFHSAPASTQASWLLCTASVQ